MQLRKITTMLGLLLPLACSHSQPNWSSDMHNTAKNFKELLPYIYGREVFNNPINKTKIQTKIQNFSNSVHEISPKIAQKLFGDDPLAQKGLKNLKELSSRAYDYYVVGKYDYAQNLLKQTSKYCFQCHTHVPMGPQKLEWQNFSLSKYNLNSFEKAQIYIAMRQYEKAKKELSNLVTDTSSKQPLIKERALKYYLLVSIRGQSDFNSAYAFIKAQHNNAGFSKNFQQTIKKYEKDLLYWIVNYKTTSHTLSSARKILGVNKSQELPTYSENLFVQYVTSALLLHNSLPNEKNKQTRSEIYYYLGSIYDYLTEGSFWDLSDTYYEMCIEASPLTAIAKKCVNKLKENLFMKSTGSGGFSIPEIDKKKLQELQRKSGYTN